jgi:hypothetical protein
LIRNITPNNLRTILTNEFVKKDDKRKKDIFTFWKGRSK